MEFAIHSTPLLPATTDLRAKTFATALCWAARCTFREGSRYPTLTQAESARPFTLTTPVGDRAVVNGVKTSLDDVRGTPYIQVDLRVSRPIHFRDRWSITPFAELFNLFNRNNPGANYVTDISALPTRSMT